MSQLKEDALNYHSKGRPGKIAVVPTKPTNTKRDLSLAYSPGVAEPCLAIAENPDDVYKYTAKGNLVAVITNGTAVLGLGDIGPEASKPVMEGKALLFKIFADIDVFDIEIDAKDPELFIQTVKAIAPTFGGINLEDIKAPEAFEIERRLKEELDIPVMHDDQHGTAIISSAALINALELAKKKIDKVKIVVDKNLRRWSSKKETLDECFKRAHTYGNYVHSNINDEKHVHIFITHSSVINAFVTGLCGVEMKKTKLHTSCLSIINAETRELELFNKSLMLSLLTCCFFNTSFLLFFFSPENILTILYYH